MFFKVLVTQAEVAGYAGDVQQAPCGTPSPAI